VTTVITISGLDLGTDKAINYMKRICGGFAVKSGNTQIQLRYPATLDPNSTGSIRIGADNLNSLIRATPGPKIVLGYSQGAQVAGAWLRKFAHAPNAPNPSQLSFVLVGNPERKYGQPPTVKNSTPDYTQYRVWDVARRDDGWCNWDGSLRRKIGMLGRVHLQYWNTDPYNLKNEVVKVVGNTTYVVAP
jgi:hypothetical protein